MNRWGRIRSLARCLLGAVALVVGAGVASLAPSTIAGATTSGAPGSAAPQASIDWATGMSFGPVANVGRGAVADCTLAAVADIEQVFSRQDSPIDPTPYVAAYDALARAAGERPGPAAGLRPADVVSAWQRGAIAGSRVRARRLAALDRVTVEQALASGPLYGVLALPAPASSAPTWVDASGVALGTWSSSTPPAGYAASGPHVVAVVGYGASGVLVATWGYVQPITWQEWGVLATAAWAVAPS